LFKFLLFEEPTLWTGLGFLPILAGGPFDLSFIREGLSFALLVAPPQPPPADAISSHKP
jgi:hypothetical protein